MLVLRDRFAKYVRETHVRLYKMPSFGLHLNTPASEIVWWKRLTSTRRKQMLSNLWKSGPSVGSLEFAGVPLLFLAEARGGPAKTNFFEPRNSFVRKLIFLALLAQCVLGRESSGREVSGAIT